jgi:hypothetical protein
MMHVVGADGPTLVDAECHTLPIGVAREMLT